ncbi:hypothetical protein [Aquisphaera giovannonii]|uniref:hypothetical protein n=1 Tax=Aquisphaera giovannonii TaxID=406548 RepID=UPI001FE4ED38|nr:hypothetical protein [Aquisphaera giovannonii]
MRLRFSWRVRALSVVLGLLAAGCSEELGPERFATTHVSGRISLGGKAVGGGFVDFLPGQGTRGNIRSARIRDDGTFEADRVPVGLVAIRIVGAPVPPQYALLFGRFPTRITRTIAGDRAAAVEIDLAEEAARDRAEANARLEEYRANHPAGASP